MHVPPWAVTLVCWRKHAHTQIPPQRDTCIYQSSGVHINDVVPVHLKIWTLSVFPTRPIRASVSPLFIQSVALMAPSARVEGEQNCRVHTPICTDPSVCFLSQHSHHCKFVLPIFSTSTPCSTLYADMGVSECYTSYNPQGNVFGNCGYSATDYTPCLQRYRHTY